jgi:hypothetical protein
VPGQLPLPLAGDDTTVDPVPVAGQPVTATPEAPAPDTPSSAATEAADAPIHRRKGLLFDPEAWDEPGPPRPPGEGGA